MKIIKNKIEQACNLLNELSIDAWVIFVRETPVITDPTLEMVVGFEATWQSFFIYTAKGDKIAMVGDLDSENFKSCGYFTEVITYNEGVKEDFLKVLKRLNPGKIAINYSIDDVVADGLTHGMYLQLMDYVKGTAFENSFVSSEKLVSTLRSVKLSEEVDRISQSANLAVEAWEKSVPQIQTGMTEKQVAKVIETEIEKTGGVLSFETIVNAGAKTKPGHGRPTDAVLETGDLLHVDFGIRINGYCSDLQRLIYFKRRDEKAAPDTLIDAFNMVYDIITETGDLCRPGIKGFEVDAKAREMLTDNGYPEYQHALGHQIGRSVHDGGGVIGPKWERYGATTSFILKENNVTTLELEIMLPGIGCVGLEEDVCVTKDGAKFLCQRQSELIVK